MACYPAQNRSSSKNHGPSLIAAKIELSQIPSTSCQHSASKRTPPTPTHPYPKTTLSGAGAIIKLFIINMLPFRTGYQTVNTTRVFWPVFGSFLAFSGPKRRKSSLCALQLWRRQAKPSAQSGAPGYHPDE